MPVRMVGLYCPNGHLNDGIAYEGSTASPDMLAHLQEDLDCIYESLIQVGCGECGTAFNEDWRFRDKVIEECRSLEEFEEWIKPVE